jgi:hypothetical protein
MLKAEENIPAPQHLALIHLILNSCEFWEFPKSKNPANRTIAGFYTF